MLVHFTVDRLNCSAKKLEEAFPGIVISFDQDEEITLSVNCPLLDDEIIDLWWYEYGENLHNMGIKSYLSEKIDGDETLKKIIIESAYNNDLYSEDKIEAMKEKICNLRD